MMGTEEVFQPSHRPNSFLFSTASVQVPPLRSTAVTPGMTGEPAGVPGKGSPSQWGRGFQCVPPQTGASPETYLGLSAKLHATPLEDGLIICCRGSADRKQVSAGQSVSPLATHGLCKSCSDIIWNPFAASVSRARSVLSTMMATAAGWLECCSNG